MEQTNTDDVKELVRTHVQTYKLNVEHTNIWYLDTRCNIHVCRKKKFFSRLYEFVHTEVNFKNE